MNREQRRAAARSLKKAQTKAKQDATQPLGWGDLEHIAQLGGQYLSEGARVIEAISSVWDYVEDQAYAKSLCDGIASDIENLAEELAQLRDGAKQAETRANGKVDIDSIGDLTSLFDAFDTWRIRVESILFPNLDAAHNVYLKAGVLYAEANKTEEGKENV